MILWRKRRKAAEADPEPPSDDALLDEAELYEVSASVLVLSEPRSAGAAALQQTAVEVAMRHLQQGRRGLAICGASAGSGVTFASVNLAVALSRMGLATLLIDGSLRQPGLEAMIRPRAPAPGLQQVLKATVQLEHAVRDDVLPNLSILYAGGAAADAGELLSSHLARQIFSRCMRDYDCVIVDTPPANRSADARTIAAAIGYAAIVGRRGHSYAEDAALLSRQLSDDDVAVIGTIFNGA